jgi:uncharacterized membrane protein
MNWQVLILLSVFTYSVSVLLQRILLKQDKSDPVAFSIVFQLITALFIGGFGVVTHQMQFPDIIPFIPGLVFMTFCYSMGNFFLFSSLKKVEASKFTIIFATRAFFTVIASTIFLREALNISQWFGAVLVFAGVILVSGNIRRFALDREEWYALLAAVFFGLAVTNDRFILKTFPTFPYVFIGFVTPAIGIALMRIRSVMSVPVLFHRATVWKMIILCAVYAVSAMTFFFGLQAAPNSSQVITINLTSVIVIVLLSIVFLKERAQWVRKIIGAALSFVGLLLVS